MSCSCSRAKPSKASAAPAPGVPAAALGTPIGPEESGLGVGIVAGGNDTGATRAAFHAWILSVTESRSDGAQAE